MGIGEGWQRRKSDYHSAGAWLDGLQERKLSLMSKAGKITKEEDNSIPDINRSKSASRTKTGSQKAK